MNKMIRLQAMISCRIALQSAGNKGPLDRDEELAEGLVMASEICCEVPLSGFLQSTGRLLRASQ